MSRTLALVIGLASLLFSVASTVYAHGREPSVGQIAFHPGDPNRIVVRSTWGFVSTRDGGETWTWQCANAVPFDRTREDPIIAIVASGSVLAGTYDGLVRSDELACGWSAPEPALTNVYVVDVQRDPASPGAAWTVVSSGREPDALFFSDDEGATWSEVSRPHPSTLSDRLRIAPSDPMRIYMSGVIPRSSLIPRDAGAEPDGGLDAGALATSPQGMFLRSSDRGATFEPLPYDLVAGEPGERTFHLLGVDPLDADRVYARAVRSVADEAPERFLVSEDGGGTWRTSAELREIVGFAMSEDGSTIWIGSWDGGLLRSTDRGASFTPVDADLRVRCLGYRSGELWVCIEGFSSGFALGRSTDGGETITPVWRFEDSTMDVGCPAGTPVGDLCPMYWPDQIFDLMLDPSLLPDGSMLPDAGAMDGSVAPVAPPSTCGCRALGSRAGVGGAALAALLGLALARRRTSRRARTTERL